MQLYSIIDKNGRRYAVLGRSTVELLTEYLRRSGSIGDLKALDELDREYSKLLADTACSPELDALRDCIFTAARDRTTLKENAGSTASDALTDTERQELAKVKGLIDNNLFTYFFQPIIRADTGEIFAYEALMRAKVHKDVTPFHILKYAELTGRLAEIEQYTFTNVLRFISENKQLFTGKLVFINSMPSVKLAPEKVRGIDKALEELSDTIVVEMTENSQFNDSDLNEVKDRYHRMGIRIAVDDYGTGYSNISNLLRYTPNFVKIDRVLLSSIQNNPNKKHFVREIVDFCHDNGITALAEGVETFDELRTVILLGVDLIQGFYTARPSEDIVSSLPFGIRSEILACSEERSTGRLAKVYTAYDGERVLLDKLAKDEYNCVLLGNGSKDATFIITGHSHPDDCIRVMTADGFRGKIVLDSAHINGRLQEPCIDIGSDNDVEIAVNGENTLNTGGIRVPASSRTFFTGAGAVSIELGNSDYYGIGGDLASAHGELVFDLDALVKISSSSHSGVCIGSGLGGKITIKRGAYVLEAHGGDGVCIGAFSGSSKLCISNCDIEAKAAGADNVIIGSLSSDADIDISAASLRCSGYSTNISAFGTVNGKNAAVNIRNASIRIDLKGNSLTACGSLEGGSDVRISGCTFRASCSGPGALLFGSRNGGTKLSILDSDAKTELSSGLGKCIIAEEKDIECARGICSVTMDGKEYDRIIY